MPSIQPITRPIWNEFEPLVKASTAEGYNFVQKLWGEYQSGDNDFRGKGDVLLGIYQEGQLAGVGGVHRDPYLDQPTIGRIRHVYVLPEHRRGGIGKMLVQALIDYGSEHFTTLTLRTMTDHGHAFYTALGFSDAPRFENATHWLEPINM
jgi:GNAT superfamily N-acetyltransferase